MQKNSCWFIGCRLLLLGLMLAAVKASAMKSDDVIDNAPNSLVLHFYSEHFPPYNFEQDGAAKGINAEIVMRLCELAKIHCDIRFYPWLRAVEYAQKDPHGGLFSIVKTQKRQPLFQWVGPLASSHSFFYKLKKRPDIQIHTLADAKQFGVAVANGDIYQELLLEQGFERGKNLLDFPTKSAPMEMFLKGKVDLVIGSEIVMPAWLAPHKATMADVEQVLELNDLGNNYLALNLQVSPQVQQRLQQALEQLKSSGEFAQIVDRYRKSTTKVIPN